MPRLPLEYSLCQLQSGQISLAIRTHRRESGNPELDIDVQPNEVIFTLINLFDGDPETVHGDRRQDAADLRFVGEGFARRKRKLGRDMAVRLRNPEGSEKECKNCRA